MDERFPAQFASALRKNGLDIADPEIIARTGWTTDELWNGIQSHPPQGVYELVTLLIGVNNQYRGLDVEAYRSEFVKLLERSVHYAGDDPTHVIVVSIPDWGAIHSARAAGYWSSNR